jgi:hypothetical protein
MLSRRELLQRAGAAAGVAVAGTALPLWVPSPAPAAATAGLSAARQDRARALAEALATRPGVLDAPAARTAPATAGAGFATALDTAAREAPAAAAPAIDAFLDALPDRDGTGFAALPVAERLTALTETLGAAAHAPYGTALQAQAIAILDAIAAVQVHAGVEHPVPELVLVER